MPYHQPAPAAQQDSTTVDSSNAILRLCGPLQKRVTAVDCGTSRDLLPYLSFREVARAALIAHCAGPWRPCPGRLPHWCRSTCIDGRPVSTARVGTYRADFPTPRPAAPPGTTADATDGTGQPDRAGRRPPDQRLRLHRNKSERVARSAGTNVGCGRRSQLPLARWVSTPAASTSPPTRGSVQWVTSGRHPHRQHRRPV